MFKIIMTGLLVLTATPSSLYAQTISVPEADWSTDEVTVFKDLPGPALWKVSKDDKVVWILGDTAIKSGTPWDRSRIERLIAGAETLYLPPVANGGVSQVYKVVKAKDLPGKQTLRDVVSPAEYARFRQVADANGIKTADIEKDKPIWAGWRLLAAIHKKHGYVSGQTKRDLGKFAKKHKVKVRYAGLYKVSPLLDQIIAMSDEDSRKCLSESLTGIDYMTKTMAAQTAAWTMGDVARLTQIENDRPREDCLTAMSSDLNARSTADTIAAIDSAMAGTKRSVLILSVRTLAGDSRLFTELRHRGFTVSEPR